MTPNHDDMTDHLGRALHERADGVGAPLTLSDVKGRATRIRRRRAIAATAAAAAAVAVIVPTAIAGSEMFDTSDSGGQQVATNPTGGETQTGGDATSWPQRLDPSDLPVGDAPAVPYTQNGVLHGGPDLELPAEAFGPVVPYDDGWMTTASTTNAYEILILDSAGQVQRRIPVMNDEPLTASADGSQVLYLEGDQLTLHDNETGDDQVVDTGNDIEVVAVENGWAFYNVGPWPYDGRAWDGSATVDRTPNQSVPYQDVSVQDEALVLTSLTDFGSCSALVPVAGGDVPKNPDGETCELMLDEFSADGDYVRAGPAYRDGFGDGEIAVFEADPEAIGSQVVFHYQRKTDLDPYFLYTVWEDDEHLLTVTFTPDGQSANGTWQILRIGLDGTIENAVEPVEADMEAYPFRLG